MAAPYSNEYTDRQKTRIYTPSSERTRYNQDDAIGQTQAIAPKERLFDGISVPQIIAGAAAAATSVALASYIGIAGSIIGAAVSSVVTVVSSQVYRRFLTASARKIKDAAPLSGGAPHGAADAAEETARMGATPVRGARIAPSKLQARAKAEREATQRKVVVFSVMAGLLAVAVCAGGIWLATAGEGLGTKVGAPAEAQNQSDGQGAPSAANAPGASLPDGDAAHAPSDQTAGGEPQQAPSTEGPSTSPGSDAGAGENGDDGAAGSEGADGPDAGSGGSSSAGGQTNAPAGDQTETEGTGAENGAKTAAATI